MEFLDDTHASIPRRVRKREENAVEKSPEFRQLLASLSGLSPGKTIGLAFDPADATALDMKWPARAAVDSLRRQLRATGLTGNYRVQKFRQGDKWFVTVKATSTGRVPKRDKTAADDVSAATKTA